MEVSNSMEHYVLLGQGLYYFITGLWALLSMRTFEKVTGPKTDHWLVKTIGLMLVVIGLALITGGVRKTITPEKAVLGVGTAGALLGIDVFNVSIKKIPRIYLLDAVAELILIVGWIAIYVSPE
jgi:sulfite exporter TauE/SafE